MSKFYQITGVAPVLDGLVIESETELSTNGGSLMSVNRLVNPNVIMGDRVLAVPLPYPALWISEEHLKEVDDPTKREYSSDFPYGKFLLEGRYKSGNIEVAFSQYERSLQVNVYERTSAGPGKDHVKTLYSENFVTRGKFENILESIKTYIKQDVDDLIFDLKEWKEVELEGLTKAEVLAKSEED